MLENDPPLSKEQLLLIEKLNENQLQEIDKVLLSNICNQWRKVARIVGNTMSNLENRVKGIPDIFYAQRINRLVEKGTIESQGNLKAMQFCEVRKLK